VIRFGASALLILLAACTAVAILDVFLMRLHIR
jgi:hypothetical protein